MNTTQVVLAPSGVHVIETIDGVGIGKTVLYPDKILVELEGIIKNFADLTPDELLLLQEEYKTS